MDGKNSRSSALGADPLTSLAGSAPTWRRPVFDLCERQDRQTAQQGPEFPNRALDQAVHRIQESAPNYAWPASDSHFQTAAGVSTRMP